MNVQGKHVVLGAGPLGTALARLLTEAEQDVQLYSVMNNPAYDMPGTTPQVTACQSLQPLLY